MIDALKINISVTKDFSVGVTSELMGFTVAGRRLSRSALNEKITEAASRALSQAARVVVDRVRSHTPELTGALKLRVRTRGADGGLSRDIYGEGIVFKTHELNGSWTKMPPHAPLLSWVEAKLGLTGREANRIAWAVQKKIKREGLTLPNVEGRGQMIERTKEEMEATSFHFEAFSAAFKEELGKISA